MSNFFELVVFFRYFENLLVGMVESSSRWMNKSTKSNTVEGDGDTLLLD